MFKVPPGMKETIPPGGILAWGHKEVCDADIRLKVIEGELVERNINKVDSRISQEIGYIGEVVETDIQRIHTGEFLPSREVCR